MSLRRSPGQIHYGSAARDRLFENALINGCFRVWQRGETITAATDFPNSDDNYCADRWCFITELNDVADLSREETVVPGGFNSAFQFTVQAAVGIPSERFGILQVIENQNCAHLIGEDVNLSFYARADAGTEVRNLRAAVISWDGAADAVTSDVVANWQAEGTDPTLVANWTYENTPTDLLLTVAYQRFTIPNIAIDTATTTNVGVFIWVDDDDLLDTELFYVAGVQLELAYPGRGVTDFVHRPIGYEKTLCRRYFEKTFSDGVAPVQALGDYDGALFKRSNSGVAAGLKEVWRFGVDKMAEPTMVYYNPINNDADWDCDTADSVGTSASIATCSVMVTTTENNHGASDHCYIHCTAEAEL